MPIAFVFLIIEMGSEVEVLRILKKVEGVEEVFTVFGVYDMIARVRADSMDKLKEIVSEGIRRIDNVRSTLTMLVIDESK
jgi:DNA-binding Lrp family transcriptional regulator